MLLIKIFKFIDKLLIFFKPLIILFSKLLSFLIYKNQNDINQVVFIKLSAMGDLLCMLRSVRAFKEANPNIKTTIITTSRSSPLFWQDVSFVDKVIILKADLFLPFHFVPAIYNISKSNLCIDFDQYYRISEIISLFSSNNFGFRTTYKGYSYSKSIQYDNFLNESEQFYKLTQIACAYFDLPLNKLQSSILEIDPRYFMNTKNTSKRYIMIYPGSGKNASFRRWDINNYIEVADTLKRKGYEVIFLGGKDEIELTKIIQKGGHKSLIGELSLSDVANLLRNKCLLFIGNDGGLFHVADIMGVPLIGVFGPSLSSKWGSLNKKNSHLEVNLSCRPCIRHDLGIVPRDCKYGTSACLAQISVDKVLSTVDFFLENNFKF